MFTALTPTDSHKSFYGKAQVLTLNGVEFLLSYSTFVAYVKDGKLFKNDDAWSMTTGRHIKAFSDRFALEGEYKGKRDWDERPARYINPVCLYIDPACLDNDK